MNSIELKKEQSRIRSARHYELKKASILEARKAQYLNAKIEDKIDTVNAVKLPMSSSKNQVLRERLGGLDLNAHTKAKYLGDLDRVYGVINNADLLSEMKNGVVLTNKIKQSNFSANTKAGMIQIILYVMTNFDLLVGSSSKVILQNYFKEAKTLVAVENVSKQNNEEVMSWKQYMSILNTKVEPTNKMYVLMRLYQEATMRDDYQLKIVPKKQKDTSVNYLVLNKNNYTIVINKYKTAGTYGVISIKLTKGFTGILRQYMEVHNLRTNDYLFGDGEQSNYIRYENKKLGLDISINTLRHMTITDLLNSSKLTPDARVRLSKRMGHSVYTQGEYLRAVAPVGGEGVEE